MSIYTWYRQYRKYEVAGLMSSKKQIKREHIDFNTESVPPQDISELQEQIKQIQMEVDVLKEALNLLKKDPGINITAARCLYLLTKVHITPLVNWDKIVDIIKEAVPTAKEIENILDIINAPKNIEEIGIDKAILPMTFEATKDIRDKYVLSRLCHDLGIMNVAQSALMA